MEIVKLLVSPLHRYDGRPGDGPAPYAEAETVTRVQVRAHLGLVGDRYFNTRYAHAAVTFISQDELDAAASELGAGAFDPALARRNVVMRGVDVESLVHTTFTVDTGDGPIRFRSRSRANPCAWMDAVFAPGARESLRGHAGIRTEPLDDGWLSVGPANVEVIAFG